MNGHAEPSPPAFRFVTHEGARDANRATCRNLECCALHSQTFFLRVYDDVSPKYMVLEIEDAFGGPIRRLPIPTEVWRQMCEVGK